jgi:hypothetical protein
MQVLRMLAIDLGLSLAVAGAGALIVARSLGALERLRLSRAMPDQGCSAADTRSAAGETTPFQEESRRTSAQEARTTLTEEQGTSAKRAGPIPNHYPVPGTARREFRPRRWDGSRRVRAAKSRTEATAGNENRSLRARGSHKPFAGYLTGN